MARRLKDPSAAQVRWSIEHLKKTARNLAADDNNPKTDKEAKYLALIYLDRAREEIREELEND